MGSIVGRVRLTFALVIGIAAVAVATAPGLGAASPSYEFVPHDSGALPGRIFSAAAGTADGESVVVYGGESPDDAGNQVLADTWVYRPDTGWVAKCGSTVPEATGPCGPGLRSTGALATGPTGVVLFGGSDSGIDGGGSGSGTGPATDTWVWDGDAWTQVCAAGTCGPAGRSFPGMAGNGDQVVLFGGLTDTGVLDDTWVFDGTTWTQTCGSGQPAACGAPGAVGAAIGWDGTQFVMFGGAPMGSSGLGDPVDDTWTFDGTKWEQACGASMSKPCGPPARSLGSLAFQRQSTAAVEGALLVGGGNLFTGSDQTLLRDAWFWRDGTWTQLTTPWPATAVTFSDEGPPGAGTGPLLALAAAQPSQCTVLFLGQNPGYAPDFGVEPQTYTAGWDLTGTGQSPGCTVETADTPGGTTAAEPAAVPVASEAVGVTGTSPASGTIARTGAFTDRLAVTGVLAIVVGLAAVLGARPRRTAEACRTAR